MKRARSALFLVVASLLSSCNQTVVQMKDKIINKPEGVMVFSPQLNLISDDFDGLGVEWGAYEDTNKLQTNAWERITKYADRLEGMSLVRCMVSFDWFCENLDTKGDTDKTNDTWTYNFNNKWMKSTEEVLTYCQAHNIEVAFGAWNVIGSFPNDTWGMMDEITSDPRWAKMAADVMEYLVLKKGFTCIKYFVNSNEPNYTGKVGSSKNANNTFAIWKQGVLAVKKALENIGLGHIKIVGSDATYINDGSFDEYVYGIADDAELKEACGDYGIHVYAKKDYLDNGSMLDLYKQYFSNIKEKDPGMGIDRRVHIWEGGLVTYKDSTYDCQTIIDTYSYATIMANYTLSALAAGVNGITYWDFDDAMHFMYNSDGSVTAKEWGMFSTLSSASQMKQQLRPWYHSSTLLINLLKRHNIIFDSGDNSSENDPSFRSIATISNDRTLAGAMFSNSGKERTIKFVLDEKYNNNEKMYVYLFNEKYTLIGQDGFIKPNYELNGSLNNITELTIPANSFVVVSNKVL